EIVLQTLETRGGDVVPVEVVHDVDEHEETAAGVEFPLEALLHASTMLGAHLVGGRLGSLEVQHVVLLKARVGATRLGDIVGHDGSVREETGDLRDWGTATPGPVSSPPASGGL